MNASWKVTHAEWEALRRNGDEAAFSPLFEASKRLVWTICFRILRDEEDALDAFQSTYARVLALARLSDDPASEGSLADWLARLAAREADASRKRRNRRRRKEIAMEHPPDLASLDRNPAQQAELHALREKIELLISTLPDRYRLPLLLHYFDGLTHDEVARTLGRSRPTVSMQIARGLRRLGPILRRAGLGEAGTMLGSATIAGALLAPPAKATAGAIFSQAQSILAASTSLGTAASAGAWMEELTTGVTLMKTKAALFGAGLLLIGTVGAIYWATGGERTLDSREALTTTPVILTEVASTNKPPQPTPGATPARSFTADSKTADAASSTGLASTPSTTVAAMRPAGPTDRIEVAVVWDDTQRPVVAASVTAAETGASPSAWRELKQSDARGLATLEVPRAWRSVSLAAHDPQAVGKRTAVTMPHGELVALFLQRAAVVNGIVLTEADRKPVAGARVTLAGSAGTTATQQTTAAADGRFEFVSIPPGKVRLAARADELRSDMNGEENIFLQPGEKHGPVELLLKQGATIQGLVTDAETGKPIATASVADGEGGSTVTDEQGVYRLRGLKRDQYYLIASHPRYADGRAQVTIAEPRDYPIDFKLNPAVSVTVNVIDTEGGPIEAAMVQGLNIKPGFIINLQSTDARGLAVIERVDRLRLPSLTAEKKGYDITDGGKLEIDAAGGRGSLTIKMKEISLAKAVAGRVTDELDRPLQGINVQWAADGAESNHERNKTQTGADGRYRLEFDYSSDKIMLAAFGEGWAPQVILHLPCGSPADPAKYDFTLKPAHWLEGQVVDQDGKPVDSARVSAAPHPPHEHYESYTLPGVFSIATTDVRGQFRIDNLTGPRVTVGFGKRGWESGEQEVEVDRSVQLTLKRLGVIRGRVLDRETGNPMPSFNIRLVSGGYLVSRYEPGETFTDSQGMFMLTDLRPSDTDFEFQVSAEGYLAKRVKGLAILPESQSPINEIEISKGRAVEGVVLNASTQLPLAQAQLAFGVPEAGPLNWDYILRQNPSSVAFSRRIQWQTMTTDEDGTFRFVEDDPGTLLIRAQGYEALRVDPDQRSQYAIGSERLSIPLKPGLELKGIAHPPGEPNSRFQINLCRLAPDGGLVRRYEILAHSDLESSGRFAFTGLTAGPYELMAIGWLPNMQQETWQQFLRHCEVRKEGENTVSFGDNLGNLVFTGRVVDADKHPFPKKMGNIGIELHPQFDWEYSNFIQYTWEERDGSFSFWGLKPGPYEVIVSRDRPEQQSESMGVIHLDGNLDRELIAHFKETP